LTSTIGVSQGSQRPRGGRDKSPTLSDHDRATVDFDRIAIGTGILCVECKACGKRAALTRENCAHIHPGNKAEVRSVTFRCSRIDCGSTDVRRYGGCDLEEAKMWLAGDPMDPDREIPTQTKWEREGW